MLDMSILHSEHAKPLMRMHLDVPASTECPYTILGVAATASADEIKAAYRKLALQLHPDVNPAVSYTAGPRRWQLPLHVQVMQQQHGAASHGSSGMCVPRACMCTVCACVHAA